MVKMKLSDKLSVAVYVLLEKGPLSISSLAEEVSKLINSKVTTVRSQLSVVLPDLIKFGLVEEVGTDRFGSRLIDVTPKTIDILLLMFSSGLEYRFIPWDSIIKYFDRRLPHLTKYVKLLICVVNAWKLKEFGPTTEGEKEYSDFLEDLAFALDVFKRLKIAEEEDIRENLFNLIFNMIIKCIESGCKELMLENVRGSELTEELKEVIQSVENKGRKQIEKLRELL